MHWDDSWDDLLGVNDAPEQPQPASGPASVWQDWDFDEGDEVALESRPANSATKRGPGRPKGTTGSAQWRKVVNLSFDVMY